MPPTNAARERNGIYSVERVLDAAKALVASHQHVGALVLQCTSMMPYAADIRAAIGLPVFTMESFNSWFQSGLDPNDYAFAHAR